MTQTEVQLPAVDSPEINRLTGFNPDVARAHQAQTDAFKRDFDARVAEIAGAEQIDANQEAKPNRLKSTIAKVALVGVLGAGVGGAIAYGMHNDSTYGKDRDDRDRERTENTKPTMTSDEVNHNLDNDLRIQEEIDRLEEQGRNRQ